MQSSAQVVTGQNSLMRIQVWWQFFKKIGSELSEKNRGGENIEKLLK